MLWGRDIHTDLTARTPLSPAPFLSFSAMAPTRTLSNTTTPSLITESHEYQDGATYEEGLERDASIESHSNLFSDAGKPTHAFQVKKIVRFIFD